MTLFRCCGVDGEAAAVNEILNECMKQFTKIIDGSARSILGRLHSGSSQASCLMPYTVALLIEFVAKVPDET